MKVDEFYLIRHKSDCSFTFFGIANEGSLSK
jgi:hypothetical protein